MNIDNHNDNLSLNIEHILKDEYVVPLYQRNFAWGEEEITQLIQDIYNSYIHDENSHYFIGSLVVLRRNSGIFEIIDGQQRMTAITLLSKILNINNAHHLHYDSRPEVEQFFSSFYRDEQLNYTSFGDDVFHYIEATRYIYDCELEPGKGNTIAKLKKESSDGNEPLEKLKKYIATNVILVRVEIPEDTDVASYFEIMNTRGDQLKKHELLKAFLLNQDNFNVETSKYEQPDNVKDIFSKARYTLSMLWESCSEIDKPIQKCFNVNTRKLLFGDMYDNFLTFNQFVDYLSKTPPNNEQSCSISDFLGAQSNNNGTNQHSIDTDSQDDDDTPKYQAIIDFSNFLMLVFKLLYEQLDKEIPLNEQYLLDTYRDQSKIIDPIWFIYNLLYFRTIFDRYIVKSAIDDIYEDGYRWALISPYNYTNSEKTSFLKYKNSFNNNDDQNRAIKAISMLQVTYRARIYKTWLYDVLKHFTDKDYYKNTNELSWFGSESNFYQQYISILDKTICGYYDALKIELSKQDDDNYLFAQGTNTPHLVFNFIDYLYWVSFKKGINISYVKDLYNSSNYSDFDFKYRNSVEHHLPQDRRDINNTTCIDCLGNLCLVSKSLNSRMDDEMPIGKAAKDGKYYREGLPPKQKIMYKMTTSLGKWGPDEIKQHYSDITSMINKRREILELK